MPSADHPAIVWYRRDLRVSDHPALSAAAAGGRRVVPVYILSDWKRSHCWTGPKRQHFLCGCLRSLAANLEALGAGLVIRHGDAVAELLRLAKETKARSIYFHLDPDPFGKLTERRLSEACEEAGIECIGLNDVSLHGPDEVLTKTEQPYRVFTPYSKTWFPLEKPAVLGKPSKLPALPKLASLPLPDVGHWGLAEPNADLPEPGERAARQRLKQAVKSRLAPYKDQRNNPAVDGTSRLSQDLRFGLLSPRTVYHAAHAELANATPSARTGIQTILTELAWREFYFAILHHYPEVLEHEFNPDWRGLPWDEPGERFEAWKTGRTGFPFVDAGMRELLATGFMHNRLRMVTAMFLTKDLHLDWRLGESFFMQHLIDGEIASNNGGWQWSAGTGADAAPYFRIQNPWTQGLRYDPQGIYIKRWIPELAGVPPDALHSPPANVKPLAKGYPLPIVDHATERDRTMAIFNRHKALRNR
jgi:deoxyribodipyrimidine photo-lyase